MSQKTDAVTLKVHTAADGSLWYSSGLDSAVATSLKVTAFATEIAAARDRPVVRVLGCPHNAALIVALHNAMRGQSRLQIASPAACNTRQARLDPVQALYAMRVWDQPPSVGGWHFSTEADYTTYALVHQLTQDRCFSDHVRVLLEAHPVWPYINFVGGASAEYAAWLLSFVVDPRWFIDARNPNRVSRLLKYLGLTPRIQQRVHDGAVEGRLETLCRTVYKTWSDRKPQGNEIHRPENFLWRIRNEAGGVKGDLRASQAFVVYLHHTWLSAVYQPKGFDGRRTLFLPDSWFKNRGEIRAFNDHLASHGIRV